MYMSTKIDNNTNDQDYIPIQSFIQNANYYSSAGPSVDTASNKNKLYNFTEGGTRISNFRSTASSNMNNTMNMA